VLLVFGALARFVATGAGARPDHPISGLVRGGVGSMYFERISEAKRSGWFNSRCSRLNVRFTPKADMVQRDRDVRFVPKADILAAV
jgi:hypothetical protein